MTTFEAKIEIVEDGFFHPLADLERNFVDANQFRRVGVSGLRTSVQFVRAIVHVGSTEPASTQLVIWAHYPRMSHHDVTETAAVLRAAYPDTATTFVLDVALSDRGSAVDVHIEAWTAEMREARSGVTAACAAQCWGTLADVERVTVRLDRIRYSATMQLDTYAWLASVSMIADLDPRSTG